MSAKIELWQRPRRERHMQVEVDPQQFNEWKRNVRRDDDDLLHAFRAIRLIEDIQFIITVEPDPVERLQKIEREMQKWR